MTQAPEDGPDPHPHAGGPVDPDVDLRVAGQREEWRHRVVLPVIALGGMVGASARYATDLARPVDSGDFPWATFGVNAAGCLLLGVLMVHVVESRAAHPLVRPFLGVGVLGGFTTFSTYAVEVTVLLDDDHVALAVGYLLATVLVALAAVVAGLALGRALRVGARGRAA